MSSKRRVRPSIYAMLVFLAAALAMTTVSVGHAREVRGGGARTNINGGGNHNFNGGGNANRNVNGGGNVNRNANINSNANINRNVNVNQNVNVNRNVDVNVDNNWNHGYGGGCCYHPVATAAAVTATVAVTAAVVGSVVNTVPSSGCQQVVVSGMGYTQCGSTWYQPQYAGTNVTYVVVNPPG